MRRIEFRNLTVLALLLVAAILGFAVPASSLHLRAVPTLNAASTSSTQEELQQQKHQLVVNDGNADHKKKSRERVRRNTYTHPDTNVGRSLEDEAWNSNFDYSNFDYDRSDGESTKITYGDKTIQVSDDPSYWQLWVWAVVVSVGLTLLCCLRKCCCR